MTRELALTERRLSEPLPRDLQDGLFRHPEFWRLVDSNILEVRGTAAGFSLRPAGYVGRVTLGDVQIRVDPKVQGALEALITYASSGAFHIERIPSATTDPGQLTALLIGEYLHAVGTYLQAGRTLRPRWRHDKSTFIRGQLDVPRTMRLHARGERHLAAQRVRVQSFDTPLNTLLARALRCVDLLAAGLNEGPSIRARARGYLLVLGGPSTETTAERVEASQLARPIERDVAELAAALVAGAGFEPHAPRRPGVVPRSWFLSMERLFEQAVRAEFRASPSVRDVNEGRALARWVFPQPALGRADPDLLVFLRTGDTVVGDVKYKEWTGRADVSDLYQLLTHAQTFSAIHAFLVYPGEAFEAVDLGRSAVGVHVCLFAVRVKSLREDISAALHHIEAVVST